MRAHRVVWVGGEPTPYREPHLAAVAAEPTIDLHVVYPARTIQRRTWTSPTSGARTTYLRGPSVPLTRLLHHDYPITPSIVGLLERERPDCVVVSGWALMASQLAIAWCRLRRVPYLLASDSHGAEPRARWRTAVKDVALPTIVKGARGWLVPGRLAGDYLVRHGATRERMIVFPLTVDVGPLIGCCAELRRDRLRIRETLGIAPDEIVVLQVGRLVPFKAADQLLRAVAVATPRSKHPLRLVLVGDGPEEAALRSLADRLRQGVDFLGFREGPDLLAAYAAADVFALVSRRETWGVVVNEAMACGLPVVLSDRVGAAADLLRQGENGELVPADDVEALAAALVRFADDEQLRRRYGERSRTEIAGWGYEPSVRRFAELVDSVVIRAPDVP